MSKLRTVKIQGKPLTYNKYVYNEKYELIEIIKMNNPEWETWDTEEYICDKCNYQCKDIHRVCYKCTHACCIEDHKRFIDNVCFPCYDLINIKNIKD